MSRRNKTLVGFAAALLSSIAVVSTAHAQCSETTGLLDIAGVRYDPHNEQVVIVPESAFNSSCGCTNAWGFRLITADEYQREQVVKMAMAALLAGKRMKFRVMGCSSGYPVIIEATVAQ